jgi:hypothetical protein
MLREICKEEIYSCDHLVPSSVGMVDKNTIAGKTWFVWFGYETVTGGPEDQNESVFKGIGCIPCSPEGKEGKSK